MLLFLEILGYLLVSFSGWLAYVKFWTMPHWNEYKSGRIDGEWQGGFDEGLDLSWCAALWVAVAALTPMSISLNCFWLWVLRQKIKRRPLIKLPKIRFPKCNLPKCPVAIKGQKPAGSAE